MKKFVEEASGGDVSMEIFVDVILRSLLHSNDELVNKLGNVPSTSSTWIDVEGEEVKLNNVATKIIANTLLHKTDSDEASPHLEDDILRLAILSCIGGSVSMKDGAIGNLAEGNSNFWTRLGSKRTENVANSIDPFAVPIVRALCAYGGGLGEALRRIADSEDKLLHDSWVLPPGALFMGECAIRGATHSIIRGMILPRRNTSLAILIPVLLNSACKLESSLLRYQKATDESVALNETYKVELSHTISPHLLPLCNACHNSAKIILQTAKDNEEFRRLDFLDSLDTDCHKWLRSKMSSLQ
jgi:hypothetical protein